MSELDGLKFLQQKMEKASSSFSNEEYVLEVPFSEEEVTIAIKKLK